MARWLALPVLGLVALTSSSIDAFTPRVPLVSIPYVYSASLSATRFGRNEATCLLAKLWDRLEIEEDPEPMWYLLNCIAGLELDLLNQCRAKCADMPDVVKFVVPTERKTRSHGANRMVTETKVKYQGYVFAKLRLCPEVYEAIQELDLCRSWMGTVNYKGYKKLPPAPVALNEPEVENFGLEDEEFEEEEEEDEGAVIVDSEDDEEVPVKSDVDQEALKVYLGLKVEDMVKVTKQGKFFKEDGIIRRLKDAKILVRFFTYGTMFEEWMDPSDVRKLSGEEILKGLSGPSKPVTQRDFDGPSEQDNNDWSERRGGGLRQSLMSDVKGARGPRNTRVDRTSRGDTHRRDMFGRSDEERRREERNWKSYQEKQRNQGGRVPVSGQVDDEWNFRGGSRPNRDDRDDSALRDVDSQWGRQSQRQQRREQRPRTSPATRSVEKAVDGKDDWSAFVSPASEPAKSEEDAFFASLMSDLSDDLGSSRPEKSAPTKKRQPKTNGQDEDDFFASLMSELSDDKDSAKLKSTKSVNKAPAAGGDDDFFAALEAELGSALEGKEKSISDDSDDFFAKLEAEMNPIGQPKTDPKGEESFPDFDVSDFMEPTKPSEETKAVTSETATSKKMKTQHSSPSTKSSPPGDFGKQTVPQLKDMLRARGLKVSGKKSELIDRLMQGQN
jgi:transcription antitermination factor NusG